MPFYAEFSPAYSDIKYFRLICDSLNDGGLLLRSQPHISINVYIIILLLIEGECSIFIGVARGAFGARTPAPTAEKIGA